MASPAQIARSKQRWRKVIGYSVAVSPIAVVWAAMIAQMGVAFVAGLTAAILGAVGIMMLGIFIAEKD